MAGVGLKKPRDGVNEQRQDQRVESKREHAMQKREAPHSTRRNLHVRNLARHSNDERIISKVAVVRRSIAGKNQAARMSIPASAAVAIKRVRVVDTENSMHDAPGKDHRGQSQNKMHREMAAHLAFVCADQKSDREKRCARRDNNADENKKAPEILFLRMSAQQVNGCDQNREPRENEHVERENVPNRN